MNNDDTGRQVFVFACNNVKQGLKALASFFKNKYNEHKHQKKQIKTAEKAEKARRTVQEPYKGKQSVKQLMQHRQQLNSIDISTDKSLRNFNKIAKKHGVDFAVKKDTENEKYLIFFKAKDSDVIASVFDEFSIKELNKNSKKESLMEKINQNEKAVKEMQNQLENSEKNLPEKVSKNAELPEL